MSLKDRHQVLVLDSLGVNNLLASGLSVQSYRILKRRISMLANAAIETQRVDARDHAGMTHALAAFQPDTIVHLAAVAHMDRSQVAPYNAFEHNVATLANTLEAARLLETGRVVFFSSSTAYGDFKTPHAEETDPCKPKNIYGAHKLIGEQMVQAYGRAYGIDWTIIRPQALYGPRCISGRVTQRFVEHAFHGKPLVIDGDGEDRLDFTHVEDVVQGTRLAIEKPAGRNQTFNIACGNATSLNELIEILRGHFPALQYTHGPLDETRPKRGTMSIAKARELLGYQPQWPIAKGMADYVEWYKGFASGAKEGRRPQIARRNRTASLAAAAH